MGETDLILTMIWYIFTINYNLLKKKRAGGNTQFSVCGLDLLSEITLMLSTVLTLEIHYMLLQQIVQEGQDSLPRCPSPNMASAAEEKWQWIAHIIRKTGVSQCIYT